HTIPTLAPLSSSVSHPSPPVPTPFPYTTLFRSIRSAALPSHRSGTSPFGRTPFRTLETAVRIRYGLVPTRTFVPCSIVTGRSVRSEEHTSELQSHLNLVCRLLLEKKKSYCKCLV